MRGELALRTANKRRRAAVAERPNAFFGWALCFIMVNWAFAEIMREKHTLPGVWFMMSYAGAAFAICRSIYRDRIRPRHDLTSSSQAFWEAASKEHERKHAERNGG